MILKILLYFLFGAFPLARIAAQYNLTHTYTVQDGLPFTEIFKCTVASDGKVYFITNLGHLIRYDGAEFKPLHQGVPFPSDRSVFGFTAEDRFGVWLAFGSQVLRVQGDQEWVIDLPPDLQQPIQKTEGALTFFDQKNRAYRYDPDRNTFKIDSVFDDLVESLGDPAYTSWYFDSKNYWLIYRNSTDTGHQVVQLNQQFQIVSKPDFGGGGTIRSWFAQPNGINLAINMDMPGLSPRALAKVDQGHLIPITGKDWNGKVRNQFLDYIPFYTQERLFFYGHPPPEHALSEDDFEIWELKQGTEAELVVRIQLKAPIVGSRPDLDQAGNFWVASHSGLVKIFSAFMGCFESHPNMVSGLHTINEDPEGNIYLGAYRNGYAVFDGNSIVRPRQTELLPFMPGGWRDERGMMYFLKEQPYGFFRSDGKEWDIRPSYKDDPPRLMLGYYITPIQKGKVLAFGLSGKGIGIMQPPFLPGQPVRYIGEEKGMTLANVLTIAEDTGGRVWYGRSSQGIGVYDPQLDTAVTWEITNEGGLGAMSLLVDSRDNLWMGTQYGLAFLEKPDRFDLLHQDANDALQLLDLPQAGRGLVTFIKEYRGQLIFGNNRGFGLLDLHSFYERNDQPYVKFFPTNQYLPGGGSEQNAVYIDTKGKVWMGNDLGAISMDLDLLPPDTVAIGLDSILFYHGENEQTPVTEDQLIIPRGQRYLRFAWTPEFDGQLHPNHWLNYQLVLESGGTVLTESYITNRDITLGYISPGKHRFSVELYKNNLLQKRFDYQLIIPPNLEETWWFWALVSAFITLAAGVIMGLVYRNKRQHQRHELATARLNQEKEELQVQAITSSLNPHFLNNTLHWVQARVRKDTTAGEVIDKLAANIRTVFTHSRDKRAFHSLWDELILVENYLKIQGERFRERYQYILPAKEERLRFRRTMVPLMQLQIHIENAIEHGLRHRKGSTGVTVRLEEEETHVLLIIEDDGIGYSNAKKRRIRNTQQGTEMLNSLHQIYNQKNQYKITTEIEDNIYLDPTTPEGYGTRITVRIPKVYNYAH
ncbi:sensor histidine kinase [Flavilitoribacter nigricans]|uniref:sensor histidine kinase n=1 Tax=Flavilitoribacter nigricans TaxID=70997 RepID=UPI00147329E7|nr:histidine kinase [Flavilitoribacter nigricans]